MEEDQPPKIQHYLQDLAAMGLNDVAIGNGAGGISSSIIQRLRTGAHQDTFWERGERIRRFHARYMKRRKLLAQQQQPQPEN